MLPIPREENEHYNTTIYVANAGLWLCLCFHSILRHTQKLHGGEQQQWAISADSNAGGCCSHALGSTSIQKDFYGTEQLQCPF